MDPDQLFQRTAAGLLVLYKKFLVAVYLDSAAPPLRAAAKVWRS